MRKHFSMRRIRVDGACQICGADLDSKVAWRDDCTVVQNLQVSS
jgi:hypothetical protein